MNKSAALDGPYPSYFKDGKEGQTLEWTRPPGPICSRRETSKGKDECFTYKKDDICLSGNHDGISLVCIAAKLPPGVILRLLCSARESHPTRQGSTDCIFNKRQILESRPNFRVITMSVHIERKVALESIRLSVTAYRRDLFRTLAHCMQTAKYESLTSVTFRRSSPGNVVFSVVPFQFYCRREKKAWMTFINFVIYGVGVTFGFKSFVQYIRKQWIPYTSAIRKRGYLKQISKNILRLIIVVPLGCIRSIIKNSLLEIGIPAYRYWVLSTIFSAVI